MAYSSLKIDIRREKILDMLRQEGRVYVSQLSKLLDATPATIRNDLSVLEKDGALERVPGGAVQPAQPAQTAPAALQIERAAEKRAIEDARFVLPNACTTKMILTTNARSLQNFFRHRCCNRAQWEIRQLAEQMRALCVEVAPHLFRHAGPPCLSGPCPEGKMSCGKMQQVREKYGRTKER